MTVQREHWIQVGLESPSDDCTAEIFKFALVEKREQRRRRPTAANATGAQRAGAASTELVVEFEDTLDPSTSVFHAICAQAVRETDPDLAGLVHFAVRYKQGATSPANPKYSGQFVVAELTTGGEVGEELDRSATFTVTQAGVSIAVI